MIDSDDGLFDVDFDVDEWHGTNAFIRHPDTDEVFRTDQNEGCRAELKRIGAVIVDLAEIAQKRAPKCAVPDRLQPVIRAMAKEANALVDCAVTGRPVDTSVMHRHVDDLLGRVQRGPSVCSAKSARRAVKLGKSYETIADLTAAMASTTTSERQVA